MSSVLAPSVHAVLAAAADNNLYRVCGTYNPATFRTAAGGELRPEAVRYLIAMGILGPLAKAEQLPDGTWAERIDLSTEGLDWYLTEGNEK
jgi:hypothetical protein